MSKVLQMAAKVVPTPMEALRALGVTSAQFEEVPVALLCRGCRVVTTVVSKQGNACGIYMLNYIIIDRDAGQATLEFETPIGRCEIELGLTELLFALRRN